MIEQALIVTSDAEPSAEADKLSKLLAFFGVGHRCLSSGQFLGSLDAHAASSGEFKLFCSSLSCLELVAGLNSSNRVANWQQYVDSVFVCAGEDPAVAQKLAAQLDDGAVMEEVALGGGDFVVSDQSPDFCGVMSGVRVPDSNSNPNKTLVLTTWKNATPIISRRQAAIYVRAVYQNVAVFLSTSSRVIDIDSELSTGIFDVREHLLTALPVVLYLKWAFANECWDAAETNACLIIDDPLLKPTYGFIDFQKLLALMKRHRFSTNIAFIPWNWRRSNPKVVRMFKENPGEYSISIHGCDHTRGEFGDGNRQTFYGKAKRAVERMTRHESNTGIRHDRVMVFPQGVFSEAAMSVLKHTELIGAVNNDTISADPHPRPIRISDVWDVALMGYSNFPLFTRRYPWEGVENFAFDILVGKPAVVVIHHDFCQDGCQGLVEFVQALNKLNCRLNWRNLGEVVRRSCRHRQASPNGVEVQMYGTELRLENGSEKPMRFAIKRRESEAEAKLIKQIRAGSKAIDWTLSGPEVHFQIELQPGQSTIVRIEYQPLGMNGAARETISYKVQTMLRRYLSEARDNYVMKYNPPFISRFFKAN